MKKRQNKKIIISVLVAVAVFLLAGAFAYLKISTSVFQNVFCAYKTNQYISNSNGNSESFTLFVIDSSGFIGEYFSEDEIHSETDFSDEATVYFTPADGEISLLDTEANEYEVKEYLVTRIKEKKIFSPYELYEISVSFIPPEDSQVTLSSVRMSEKEIDIGNVIIETVEETADKDAVTIGISLYGDEGEDFYLHVENNGDAEIALTGATYIVGEETYDFIEDEVIIPEGDEWYEFFEVDVSEISTIKPVIIYRCNDEEFTYIPVSSTKYITELSDDDIRAYLKSLDE